MFSAGLATYPGSKPVYCLFSFSFLFLLISTFRRQAAYGYIFLALFLWLGFWSKHLLHLVIGYGYIERVGSFDGAPASWDTVLLTASAGAAGVLAARQLYLYLSGQSTLRSPQPGGDAPAVYKKWRSRAWIVSLSVLAVTGALNSYLGIHRIGLVAATVLPWHLNGLVAWILNIGAALWLALLLNWEIASGGRPGRPLLGSLSGAFISSVSTFSRGTFVYLGVPVLLAAFYARPPGRSFTLRQAGILLASALLLLVALFAVSTLRNRNYTRERGVLSCALPSLSAFSREVRTLVFDRWIGLEGLMAVKAFSGKSPAVLFKALTEKRTTAEPLFFEQVSNSDYRGTDRTRFQFASIPGSIAFFYYSGSNWTVFFGMFLLTACVLLFELYAWAASGNPFLCALVGMAAANTAAQFGTAPGQMLPHFGMILVVMTAVGLARGGFFRPAWRSGKQ